MVKKYVKYLPGSGSEMTYNKVYPIIEEVTDSAFASGIGVVTINDQNKLQVYDSSSFDLDTQYIILANNLNGVPMGTPVRVIKEYTHPSVATGHGYMVAVSEESKMVRIEGDSYFVQE